MAGHSKWANIRFRKGAQDKRRGKLFTKLIREITVSAREGGGDASSNPRLRTAIDRAKAQSMPKDNIERALKRGTGEIEGVNYEDVSYEGYGPGGVAVLVRCTTDNRNRTVAEVRHAFTKYGGNLGADGSVSYLFKSVGLLTYPAGTNEDSIMEASLEAGAEDIVTNEDGSIDVFTSPEDFETVRDAMKAAKLATDDAEVTMHASTSVSLDAGKADSMMKMLEMLEDLDDVAEVHSNAEIADDILAGLQDTGS